MDRGAVPLDTTITLLRLAGASRMAYVQGNAPPSISVHLLFIWCATSRLFTWAAAVDPGLIEIVDSSSSIGLNRDENPLKK
jgi:hypothetical protein